MEGIVAVMKFAYGKIATVWCLHKSYKVSNVRQGSKTITPEPPIMYFQ